MELTFTDVDQAAIDQAMRRYEEDFDERLALFRQMLGEKLFKIAKEATAQELRGKLLYRLTLDATSRFLAEAGHIEPGLRPDYDSDIDEAISIRANKPINTMPEFDALIKSTPEEEAERLAALNRWGEAFTKEGGVGPHNSPETHALFESIPEPIEDTFIRLLVEIVSDQVKDFEDGSRAST